MAMKSSKGKKQKGKTLHDLLLAKLSALYDVEKELVKALPKMAKAATDKDLSAGFKSHLEETKDHVKRLEEAFNHLDAAPQKTMKSFGIRGIIKDGDWVIKNVRPKEALDANLIAAASYAEHYEMAGYTAAKEWARMMGHDRVVELLDANLSEEIMADQKMADLGEEGIFENADASMEEQA
jgi:ferritin-like metal-binding protein YciE